MMTRRVISSILLVASIANAQAPYNVELYPYAGASMNFGTTDNSSIYIGSRFNPYFGFEAGYMFFKTKEMCSYTPGTVAQRIIRMQNHAVQHNGLDVEHGDVEEDNLQNNHNTYDSEDEGEAVNQASKKGSEEHKSNKGLSSSTDSFVFLDKSGSSSPAMSSPGKPVKGGKSSVFPSNNPSPLSMSSGFGTENADIADDNPHWQEYHGNEGEEEEEEPADNYEEVIIIERTPGVAYVNTTKVYGPYLNATFFLPVYQWECGSFEVFSSVGISFLTIKSSQEPFYRHHTGEINTFAAKKIVPKFEVGGIYMFGGSVGVKGSVGWINTKKLGRIQSALDKASPVKNMTYFGAGILWRF